jgi:hypothetical protein
MPPVRLGLLSLLLLLPALPACEGPRTIAGRVRDGAGNPIPNALLRTRDDVGDVSAERTDSAGRFSLTMFASMLSARAVMRVDAEGYHRRYVRLPFREGVEVVLTPDSVRRRGPDWSDPETLPVLGLHYSIPLRFSYAVGVSRGQVAPASRDYRGWLAAVEHGEGGVKGYLGYERSGAHVGAQLTAAMLRTGNRALTVAPRQSYAGAEARIFLTPVTFTIGGYGRIAGSAPGDGRLLSVGFGLGR